MALAVDARELQAVVGYLHAWQFCVNKYSAVHVAGNTKALSVM